MKVRFEPLSAAVGAAWDEYVDRHPRSTCYHDRAWQTAAQRAYGVETRSLLAMEDGRVRGLLPVFFIRNFLFSYAVTGIFGAYGAVLSDDEATAFALLEEAKSAAWERGARHVIHKTVGDEPLAPGWEANQSAVTATLSLAPGPDAMWKGFRSEIRNRVRKAEKHGMEVRIGGDELAAFYEVLAANMHRKGTPIYGIAFIRALLDAFADRACIITLRLRGEPVAGALVIEHGGVVHVPFISSLERSFSLAPSNLLYWEIIKRSCARGQTALDFGRSFRESGNLDFKLRWGASLVPQPFHYVYRDVRPHLEPGNATVQRFVRLWKALPRALADRVGPAICGRFLL